MLGMPLTAARDAQGSRVVGAFNHTLVPSDPSARGTARVTPPASLLVEHTSAEPFHAEELVAGRRTLTPPDPQLTLAERRLVSNLEHIN
jgi:hypothetical protein